MNPGEILETLSSLPHFRSLDEERLRRLAACCHGVSCRVSEALFLQGDPCTAFYVIREGGVRLYRANEDGSTQTVHTLFAGQSFAEAAVLQHGFFPVSAEATATPTELVAVAAEPFLRLFRGDPRLAEWMVSGLCQQLMRLVARVEQLTTAGAEARLARYLLSLPAEESEGQLVVELPMPKNRLAGHLAIAPETLSRLLRRWRASRILEVDGGRLTLLEVDGLEGIVDGTAESSS